MNFSAIKVSTTDGVARITLARPERRNAIDLTTCEELASATSEIEKNPDAKVLILSGEGKFFSVGGDIDHFVAHKGTLHDELVKMTSAFHEAILSMHRMSAPVIVAVNGIAAGGGFSLVCGADLAIAKRSAKLVSAYTRSGLTPDGGGTWYLPRLVGAQKAFDLMATNPTLTADEALKIGIVGRVVDDAQFESEVDAVAKQIAALPSGAAQSLKRLLHASAPRSLEAQLADEAATLAKTGSSATTLAMLEAFLKKN